MKKLTAIMVKVDAVLYKILSWLAVTMLAVLAIIMSLNIINRAIPMMSFHWLDEIVELSFAAMVFYGAAAVWMRGDHFSAGDWLIKRIRSPIGQGLYRVMLEAFSLLFMAILLRYSWNLMTRAGEVTAVFQIPKQVLYLCIPVSSAIMLVYSALRLAKELAALISGKNQISRVQRPTK